MLTNRVAPGSHLASHSINRFNGSEGRQAKHGFRVVVCVTAEGKNWQGLHTRPTACNGPVEVVRGSAGTTGPPTAVGASPATSERVVTAAWGVCEALAGQSTRWQGKGWGKGWGVPPVTNALRERAERAAGLLPRQECGTRLAHVRAPGGRRRRLGSRVQARHSTRRVGTLTAGNQRGALSGHAPITA